MKDISRRDFIKVGALGSAAVSLGVQAETTTKKPQAKSVIEVWLWGGASHLETFDPKPDAGNDYNAGYKSIKTNVPGIEISEFLPKLAKMADKYSIIRGMTHGVFGHETATYLMQTGRKPDSTVFPSIGAVIGKTFIERGDYKGKLPPYVVIPRAKGRFSEVGFLNPKYKPLATGGDPNKKPFIVEGIVTPGVTKEDHRKKRQLLNKLDSLGKFVDDPSLKQYDTATDEAYELITGSASDVFNLEVESKELRASYGANSFGQACLVARKLVEYGVPYVAINFGGWDTHKQHFQQMTRKMPELDSGLSTLLKDLEDRKLLDTTVVWCSGEFGRKPKISYESPWNGGRQHFGSCFSALVAGGGFKGGQVVGKTDATGDKVVERPVFPQDFLGSIYELMGINPDDKIDTPMGEKLAIMPKESEFGRLKELYKRV